MGLRKGPEPASHARSFTSATHLHYKGHHAPIQSPAFVLSLYPLAFYEYVSLHFFFLLHSLLLYFYFTLFSNKEKVLTHVHCDASVTTFIDLLHVIKVACMACRKCLNIRFERATL